MTHAPRLFDGIVEQTEFGHELCVVPESHGGLLGAADGEAEEEEVVEDPDDSDEVVVEEEVAVEDSDDSEPAVVPS